jgi:hypothetical protein
VDEGIVEGGKDTGNAENELACPRLLESSMRKIRIISNIPSPARGPRETFSLAAVVVFLGGILGVLVVGWNMEQEKRRENQDTLIELDIEKAEIVCALQRFHSADWSEVNSRRSSELQPEAERQKQQVKHGARWDGSSRAGRR